MLVRFGVLVPKCAYISDALYAQVVQEALDKAKLTEEDLSAVAVTIGPGLSLCLRGNLLTLQPLCSLALSSLLLLVLFLEAGAIWLW